MLLYPPAAVTAEHKNVHNGNGVEGCRCRAQVPFLSLHRSNLVHQLRSIDGQGLYRAVV